jgi:hypothetical protein
VPEHGRDDDTNCGSRQRFIGLAVHLSGMGDVTEKAQSRIIPLLRPNASLCFLPSRAFPVRTLKPAVSARQFDRQPIFGPALRS